MPIVTMHKLSDTMVEGTLVKWVKTKGDKVEVGDILAEVETDKATMEMEAFDEGTLSEVYVAEGGIIKVGDKIALILADGETAETAPVTQATPTAEKPKTPAPAAITPLAPAPRAAAPANPGRTKASPLARKVAAARGVHLSSLAGTGPGGRIVKKDVENAPAGGGGGFASPATAAIRAAHGIAGEEKIIALTGMRKTIAERLLASKTQIPHFYLSVTMDG